MEFNCRSLKESWKSKVLCGRLATSDNKQGQCKIKSSN